MVALGALGLAVAAMAGPMARQSRLGPRSAPIALDASAKLETLKDRTVVVKYGGHAMTSDELRLSFYEDVVELSRAGVNVVVVHGGGPQITSMLKRLDIPSEFVDGRRVTDPAALEVVRMVLGGVINSDIVSAISRLGAKAVGITGQASGLLGTTPLDPDLGLVGDPTHVDVTLLRDLTAKGIIAVVAPVGVGVDDGLAYNVNADTAAGAIAEALGASRLLLLTDVAGVLDSNGELLETIVAETVSELEAAGTVSGGMIPKVQTAAKSVLEGGVDAAIICDGRRAHALKLAMLDDEAFPRTVLARR